MLRYDGLIIVRQLLILILLVLLLVCDAMADPRRLLAIASNYLGPTVQLGEHFTTPTDEARLEALRALLRLQSKTFTVTLPPINAKDTTAIDHFFIETLRFSTNTISLLATPTHLPGRKAAEGAYWGMEVLTFEKSGKLLTRQPYKDKAVDYR
jgi:hypothetical protein